MISDTGTRVLLATMRQDRPTVRSVASEAGCAISTAYVALRKLEARGLVAWKDGKQGTLRATCEVVADLGKCGPSASQSNLSSTTMEPTYTNGPGDVSAPRDRGSDWEV